MNREELFHQIKKKNTYLCIGLDPDLDKLPEGLPRNLEGLLEFHKRIITATEDLCIAYKPNLAFYEKLGHEGWDLLTETLNFIPSSHFTIADAKRSDIANTSDQYAEAFFGESLPFKVDAMTINPYMGEDSIRPFLKYPSKWTILLALTSNPGSQDFQKLKLENGRYLFEEVLLKAKTWAGPDQMMFVVGATQPDALSSIRALVPEYFLLVPGIGAQGGDLGKISKAGMNSKGGLIINASRSILYASSRDNFDIKARDAALLIQKEMAQYLRMYI